MSTLFNFANKENATHLSKPAPKTPGKKSSIFKDTNNNNNHNNGNKIQVLKDGFKTPTNNKGDLKKRIPLGGKDKNINAAHQTGKKLGLGLNDHQMHRDLTSSAAKRRMRRLKTPMSNRPVSRKLNVLKDDDPVETMGSESKPLNLEDFDDEIEIVPEREPPLPYQPLNYDPFTEEELNILKTGNTNPRTFDCTDDVRQLTTEEIYEEYPLDFESEDEFENSSITSQDKNHKQHQQPHFMEPTFVSKARSKSNEKKIEVFDEGLTSAELQRMIDEE